MTFLLVYQEVTVDFMDEFDDEDPPSSDEDPLGKAVKHYSGISQLDDDDADEYQIV